MSEEFGHGPSTIRLGDRIVHRMGFGAMQLPGKEAFGEPSDPERCRNTLRMVRELGINFIDTSWYYGPHVSNRFIAEVLHPYPKDLVIATKLGGKRGSNGSWLPAQKPDELKQGCEEDLGGLRLDCVEVAHLRVMNGICPFADSFGAMVELQKAGKVRHLALSNVSLAQVKEAQRMAPVVAVQNLYNIGGGGGTLARAIHSEIEDADAVVDYCAAHGIAFLPFFPLAVGNYSQPHPALTAVCKKHNVAPAQVALACLLARSPAMLPIPGTSRAEHLRENWQARLLRLSDEEVKAVQTAARAAQA